MATMVRTSEGYETSNIPMPAADGTTRLIPVVDWHKHHSWPPLGGLRHLIFFSSANGATAWIRRVGRRVLVDERAFFEWVRTNSLGAPPGSR